MSLCSWVNVVVGRMTAIDRAAKHVVVSQEGIVLYDHLILCTGQQYQVRPRMAISMVNGYCVYRAYALGEKGMPSHPTAAMLYSLKSPAMACTHHQNCAGNSHGNPFQEKHSAQGKKSHKSEKCHSSSCCPKV